MRHRWLCLLAACVLIATAATAEVTVRIADERGIALSDCVGYIYNSEGEILLKVEPFPTGQYTVPGAEPGASVYHRLDWPARGGILCC